jgi:hypothetical protein
MTATRKPAPRKRATPKPKPKPKPKVAPALGLVLDRSDAQAENERLIADREPLFTIGETTYTVPRSVPAAWTIQAVRIIASDPKHGEAAALDWGFQMLLGEEGYRALTSYMGVSNSDWGVLSKAITDRLIPDPKA